MVNKQNVGLKHADLKKLLRIMKLFTLSLFVGMSMVYALDSYSETTRISLNMNNSTLREVLDEIERNSEFIFFYQASAIDENRNVQINVKNQTINEILNRLFAHTNNVYSIDDRQVYIAKNSIAAPEIKPEQSKIRITGTVTDQAGDPLIGANVVEKNTTNGNITDLDGKFTLEVENGRSVLQISFIGYVSQEFVVGNQTNLSIALLEDNQSLEEVVVVGYGVQRKSDVTGSISVATAEDILASSSFSALDGLRGKAAGVNIFSSTANPLGLDGAGPRVVIRGMNSINTSSDPLYVVDGVQMSDIQFVNPNDIERIEILKDASATAIYGARGANGVILVTTNRGNVGEGKTTVSYSGWVSVGTMAKKIDLMNASEFMEMEDIAFANIGKYPRGQRYLQQNGLTELKPDRSDPLIFDANGNPLYDIDWQEEVTRDALSHSHQLNVQHQGQKASVGSFFNYTDQQGIVLNNYAKRVSGRLTYDAKPVRWLDISSNLMINHTWGNTIDDIGIGQTARRAMWEMPPIIPVKFLDGSWGGPQFPGSKLNFGLENIANPVQELTTSKRTRLRTKLFGNLGFTFHLMDGLDLRTQFGIDANMINSKDYLPNDLITVSAPYGQANIIYRNNYYWQEETFLSYNKVLNNIHRINATLGLSWSQFSSSMTNTGNIREFSSNFFGYDNLGVGLLANTAPTSDWNRWAMNSYFARGSYTLQDKYLATLTFRIDGSSRFGENNKYGFFPSVGLGWIISNEDFMQDVSWLSNLKLHTSFGQTGNTEISNYRSLALMTTSTTLLNNARVGTAQMANMPNPDLSWEKTTQSDIGINLSLFDHRVELDLDYYYKMTDDLLLERPLPFTTGFSSVWENMGRVDNSGIDFMLTTKNINNRSFSWETTLNMNYNHNEVKHLGENDEDIIFRMQVGGGSVLLRVGEPLGNFYTQRRTGLWSTAEAAEAAKVNAAPGEAKRTTEQDIAGNGMPTMTGSLINKLKYKNFDMTVDLQFVTGVDVWETYFGTVLDRAGVANGLSAMLTEGWREDRQNTMVQQIRHTNYAGQSSSADSYWISDGSYLRGNLIQLGYTMDKALQKKWGMQNLRLYLSVKNVFLLHSKSFRGYDPEASSDPGRWGQNVFFFQYPRERTYTLGLNFSF
ncbi:MAG: TonB-dependent receptor [Tannerella sp.]|jgi:TonB-linked SusC/RagA family outer membrane protein|nr:TonB-dependent receptor [Tannerella sp.]